MRSPQAWLSDWLRHRRRRRLYAANWKVWKQANPDGTHAQFYIVHARQRERLGLGPRTLGLSIEPREATERGLAVVETLRLLGLQPHHTVVDFGCGSLWIGEALMQAQEPDRYIGLDISDDYYAERLPLLPAGLVAEKRPTLAVIGPTTLAAARARRPDFVLATGVLLHVVPQELDDFFRNLAALAVPGTRIFVQHAKRPRTQRRRATTWRHGADDIDRVLAPLGYRARWPEGADPLWRHNLFEMERRAR